ncbi:MAG: 1-deoxy-D-xylulose-5-phosphate reductoisomerase [Anaerolineae bacterium]|nr:1-deoxy-D-xylulose-5-phosphate reductoisomerase [Phycisphaerae bacterium]
MSRRNVAILGSTGSIGCNAIEVIAQLGEPFHVVAISGNTRIDKLVEQTKVAKPQAVGIGGAQARDALGRALRDANLDAKVYCGPAGLAEMVRRDDVDIVVAAIVGFAGLEPVLAAVEAGKTVALANKESLVVAGSILIPLAKCSGAKIIPVDSEHSAIFQAMACGRASEVKRVILTASGGPFRDWPIERMRSATLSDALNHPTWRMGDKVTIDSATMFNKALEIVEACWLFDLPPEKVEVVVHPESVVHSMVEFIDGSTIAQLSPPDMRTPIQYALTYPDRRAGIGRTIDLTQAFSLNFSPPDPVKFGALRLAYDVATRKGTLGAVLNAANEIAVAAFVAGSIPFWMICDVVARTIHRHQSIATPTLRDLIDADDWARRTAEKLLAS